MTTVLVYSIVMFVPTRLQGLRSITLVDNIEEVIVMLIILKAKRWLHILWSHSVLRILFCLLYYFIKYGVEFELKYFFEIDFGQDLV